MKQLFTLLFCFGLAGATLAQPPSQQWISVLNSGTSSIHGLDVCRFGETSYNFNRFLESPEIKKARNSTIINFAMFTEDLYASNGIIFILGFY